MENGNSKRVTKEQKHMLIQYMEEHREFAHDRFANNTGFKNLLDQWNHLARKLNACGGAIKDGEGWKRAWINMRSKAKQKFLDSGNAMERSGVNSSISDKHLSNSDERIISVMNTAAFVGQTEVGELLSSSDAVTSVEIFDTPAANFKIEFVGESVEKPQTENMVLEDPLPPQHGAPKRRIDIEERRLAMEERKIAALETRNSIELRKADALEQNNTLLSKILKKLDDILQK